MKLVSLSFLGGKKAISDLLLCLLVDESITQEHQLPSQVLECNFMLVKRGLLRGQRDTVGINSFFECDKAIGAEQARARSCFVHLRD